MKKSEYIISELSNMVLKGQPDLVLKKIPDQSVDMIFTSPSYYDVKGKISKYDTYEQFLTLIRDVVRECQRTLIDGKFFIINTSHVLLPRVSRNESSTRIAVPYDIHRIFVEEGFEFMDDIIWQKPEGAGNATARGCRFSIDRNPMQYKALPVTEYVMVYRKKPAVLIDYFIRNHPNQELVQKSKIADGYEKTNVWRIAATKDKNYSGILPRELVEKIISYYSFVNDVVLDPFGGVGTTAMAAANLKRRFVAIESEDDCVETMCSELDNLPDMFNYFEYEYKDYSSLVADPVEKEVDVQAFVQKLLKQGVDQRQIVKVLKEKFLYQKLLLLDTARKYFTVSQIKTYIDTLSASGFTHLQLYFSDNQGFRFALDDMMIRTSSGISYDLRPCLGRGYAQPDKKMYPHATDEVWSEADMDEIIYYANEKNIEIIPCINAPGHMGQVLEHFPQFRYTDESGRTSKSSIDLRDKEAVSFAYAFVEKYVKYFKDKGCRYFNLGADEYANDVEGMGFEGLLRDGLYKEFVAFINKAAQMVIDEGMTPRIFNDGAYYGDVEDFALNPEIEVYYWERYDRVASVSTCIHNGHKVINTNKNLYYVVAIDPWICVNEKVAKHFDKNVFADGIIVSDSIGTMMCIWCDDGRDETMTTEEIMKATLPVIRALKL